MILIKYLITKGFKTINGVNFMQGQVVECVKDSVMDGVLGNYAHYLEPILTKEL